MNQDSIFGYDDTPYDGEYDPCEQTLLSKEEALNLLLDARKLRNIFMRCMEDSYTPTELRILNLRMTCLLINNKEAK